MKLQLIMQRRYAVKFVSIRHHNPHICIAYYVWTTRNNLLIVIARWCTKIRVRMCFINGWHPMVFSSHHAHPTNSENKWYECQKITSIASSHTECVCSSVYIVLDLIFLLMLIWFCKSERLTITEEHIQRIFWWNCLLLHINTHTL